MNNSEQGPSSQQKLNHACRKKILVTMASAAMLFGGMTASKSAGQSAEANTLSSTPTSGPFGSVSMGTTKSQTIELKNSGKTSVTVSSAKVSGRGFALHGMTTPLVVAAGKTASMTLSYTPTVLGYVTGSISVASNASNKSLMVVVSGTGVAASALTATPATGPFGSVSIGTTKSHTIDLKNEGKTSVTISRATVSGKGFTLHGMTTPLVLAADKTASMTLSYTPTALGYVTGSISIASNASNKTLTVPVSGTGETETRTITATPASLSFANENVGSSHTLAVTLRNTGTSSVTLSGITTSGAGITASGGKSGTVLAPGQTTIVDVTFAPKVVGSVTGSLKVTSNAKDSPVTIGLSGDGVGESALTATPASASFGSVPIGTTNSQTVKLENSGSSSVTISRATVSGKGFALHGITTPLVLGGGKAANITLSYAPTVTGYVAGTVLIESNASNKTLTMTVSGTGETTARTITATPASLSFGNETVGRSHTLALTLKNTGNSSVSLLGITASGAGITTGGVTSGTTIAPGQSATVDVTFAPKTTGSVSGSVKVTSNATNSPATIGLTGDGVAASAHSVILNWDASSSADIIGYHVYRAIGTNAYAKLVTSPVSGLNYTDATVTGGTTYKYAVTAVDSAGMESAYSTPVSVTVPWWLMVASKASPLTVHQFSRSLISLSAPPSRYVHLLQELAHDRRASSVCFKMFMIGSTAKFSFCIFRILPETNHPFGSRNQDAIKIS
jgi:hypothetical protein